MVSRPQHSHTVSHTVTQEQTEAERQRQLRLVGSPEPDEQPARSAPRVSWTEDTVDNEHLNRKKSKICCIFHPNKEFDESSEEEIEDSPSESSSSSSSDSDSDSDAGGASDRCCHNHHHHHGHHHRKKGRPNAYERFPKLKR